MGAVLAAAVPHRKASADHGNGNGHALRPLLGFNDGRSELRSRVRRALSLVVDRRPPIDIVRDGLEERALELAEAA